MKTLTTIFLLFPFFILFSQDEDAGILLTNKKIQYESTEAVNALYNFKFDLAEKRFKWLMQEHPNHPMPYFLMGLSAWWKMMPNDEIIDYEDDFYTYMNKSIKLARELHKQNKNNYEAKLFLAFAHGLKARRMSDKDNYAGATVESKKALNYMVYGEKANELNPEFLLGSALYNYFRDWIPQNKPFLRPIIMFFPKGDKATGIKQLKEVADQAFYTRIEALNFLIMVYEFENQDREAYPIAEYLHKEYPDNAYFHRKYMSLIYSTGPNKKLLKETANDALKKYNKGMPGYEDLIARYANYYLGYCEINIKQNTKEQNILILERNKSIKSQNKKLKNVEIENQQFNKKARRHNKIIFKNNESITKNNNTFSDSLNDKEITSFKSYNKKIKLINIKIRSLNKKVEQSNNEIIDDNKKLMLYYNVLRMEDGTPGEFEFTKNTKLYFEKSIEFGEKLHYEKKNYHLNALYFMSKIEQKEGNIKKAVIYAEELRRLAPNKSRQGQFARQLLSRNKN